MNETISADRAADISNKGTKAVSKEFILAGAAIFTIATPEGHKTYKIRVKDATDRFPATIFVSLLVGPDNESDYAYLGILNAQTGAVRTTGKSCRAANHFDVRLLERILARVWANDHSAYESKGYRTFHEGKCGRCGRTLTVPASVESGIGPECARKMS